MRSCAPGRRCSACAWSPARPLDRQLPADTLEIPVELSADTAQGLLRAGGWYRLHRRLDGSGWEITSASLRPHLD
jgi:hypothetical protein